MFYSDKAKPDHPGSSGFNFNKIKFYDTVILYDILAPKHFTYFNRR